MKSLKSSLYSASQEKTYRQFVKFAIVGAINTGVDWGIFYILKVVFPQFMPFSPRAIKQIAKACSFVVSALSSYIMNRKWTFRSQNQQVGREAAKFMIVALGGLVINQAVFYGVTAYASWRDIYGLILATVAATLWNFFLNQKWTFKEEDRLSERTGE